MSDASDIPMRIHIIVGDITTVRVDAIVNAANRSLLGGGGVDGAIHRAAGPRLKEYNRHLGGCPTGEAKISPSFDLEKRGVKHIIHTVGPAPSNNSPVYDPDAPIGDAPEDGLLASCYDRSLELATVNHCVSIAFPAISTGVYHFPKERAARIALGRVRKYLERHDMPETVIFCCFSESDAALYRRVSEGGEHRI